MAYLIVYRGAYALWKSFIVKRCRDTAQTSGLIINNLVNLFGGHSGMNLLCYQIEHCNIDLAALTDTFNLFWCFDHLMGRYGMALSAEVVQFFIKFHVAVFIFFLAAAPAWVVAAQFFLRHCCYLLSNILLLSANRYSRHESHRCGLKPRGGCNLP